MNDYDYFSDNYYYEINEDLKLYWISDMTLAKGNTFGMYEETIIMERQ